MYVAVILGFFMNMMVGLCGGDYSCFPEDCRSTAFSEIYRVGNSCGFSPLVLARISIGALRIILERKSIPGFDGAQIAQTQVGKSISLTGVHHVKVCG